MLVNKAKNLTCSDFPEWQARTQTLQQVDRLMGQAQGIQFRVTGLDQQFRQLFPQSFPSALRTNDQVIAARTRLGTAMSAYPHTLPVQAQADPKSLVTGKRESVRVDLGGRRNIQNNKSKGN